MLCNCIYHIFKRAIAEEVKSNADRRNIKITYLELHTKNSDQAKSYKSENNTQKAFTIKCSCKFIF